LVRSVLGLVRSALGLVRSVLGVSWGSGLERAGGWWGAGAVRRWVLPDFCSTSEVPLPGPVSDFSCWSELLLIASGDSVSLGRKPNLFFRQKTCSLLRSSADGWSSRAVNAWDVLAGSCAWSTALAKPQLRRGGDASVKRF